MQKKLYTQLVDAANLLSFMSIFGVLPNWLAIPAGLVCFLDFILSQIDK